MYLCPDVYIIIEECPYVRMSTLFWGTSLCSDVYIIIEECPDVYIIIIEECPDVYIIIIEECPYVRMPILLLRNVPMS